MNPDISMIQFHILQRLAIVGKSYISLVAGYLDPPLIKCSVNKRNSVGIEGTPSLKFL